MAKDALVSELGVAATDRSSPRAGLEHPVVTVTDLSRSFGERAVLTGISFELKRGEFVAVLGRSGSGKSTLLRAIAGLDHDVSGAGTIEASAQTAVIFQDARLLPWATVLDNVKLGLTTSRSDARARSALAEVGLAGREKSWPNALSGGEQQRVALARALVRDPHVLLADEPFGALDALTRITMHGLLRALIHEHRPAVLLVTHDVDEAVILADRAIVIDHGTISLDLPLKIEHPRRFGDVRLIRARQRLLAALGVPTGSESDPEPDADADADATTGWAL